MGPIRRSFRRVGESASFGIHFARHQKGYRFRVGVPCRRRLLCFAARIILCASGCSWVLKRKMPEFGCRRGVLLYEKSKQ